MSLLLDTVADIELFLEFEDEESHQCENPTHHELDGVYLLGLPVHLSTTPIHWVHYVCPCGRDNVEKRCHASILFTQMAGGFECLSCNQNHKASCMINLGPVKQ